MRVICINEDAWPGDLEKENTNGRIKNGKVYDVIEVFLSEGYIWYVLSIDKKWGYWENCFARTSGKSETEMKREYNFKTEIA
jgi:hypothetical protein